MKSFAQLFAGGVDSYTTLRYVPGTNRDGDKLEGNVVTIHGPVTQDIYDAHVEGRKSIGIVPIRKDDTVSFVAIDVDVYGVTKSLETVKRVWSTVNNPFIPCWSKSGGIHLFAFFQSPVPASYARKLAGNWARKLGLDKYEIFPKQDTLTGDGNAINIPFFGRDRHAIDIDGEPIHVDEFLEVANNRLLLAVEPEKKERATRSSKVKTLWDNGPPCIQHEVENAPITETRDEKMRQFSVLAWRATQNIDEAFKLMQDWNEEFFAGAIDAKAMDDKRKQLEKGSVIYGCKSAWAVSVCDRASCLKRDLGIGKKGGTGAFKDMEAKIEEIIEMYGKTGAPQYKVKIYGHYVFFESVEELTTLSMFQNKVLLTTNKALEWDGRADQFALFIRREIVDKKVVDDRSDNEFTTLAGIVVNKFKGYVRSRVGNDHAQVADSEGYTHYDGETLWVPVSEVIEQMEKVKMLLNRKIDRRHIDAVLRDFGCSIESNFDDGNIYYTYRGQPWWPVESEHAKNQPYT